MNGRGGDNQMTPKVCNLQYMVGQPGRCKKSAMRVRLACTGLIMLIC
jgi:hypothetical protein